MVYTLNNRFVDLMQGVLVVGCGGTGGYVAEGLCRLLSLRVNIVLMDMDVVETTNLLRQNFYPADLGKFKAQVLAERLSQQFNRRVGYSLHYAKSEVGIYAHPDPLSRFYLTIGCVDNHLARQAIQKMQEKHHGLGWWVDSGNAENWGQVLIGNRSSDFNHSFNPDLQECFYLPMPTIQRPELLLPPAAEAIDPDCAEAVQVGDQSPTINQAMASLVLEVVRRLITGTCPWMSLFLDLDTGELKPTYATPENVSRLTKIQIRRLLGKNEQWRIGY